MPTMSPEEARRVLIRAARQMLRHKYGRAVPRSAMITVLISGPEGLVIRSDEPAGPPRQAPVVGDLGPLQKDILAALNTLPHPGKTVARMAGRKYNSSFREALAGLVEMRLAVRTRGGYARA